MIPFHSSMYLLSSAKCQIMYSVGNVMLEQVRCSLCHQQLLSGRGGRHLSTAEVVQRNLLLMYIIELNIH